MRDHGPTSINCRRRNGQRKIKTIPHPKNAILTLICPCWVGARIAPKKWWVFCWLFCRSPAWCLKSGGPFVVFSALRRGTKKAVGLSRFFSGLRRGTGKVEGSTLKAEDLVMKVEGLALEVKVWHQKQISARKKAWCWAVGLFISYRMTCKSLIAQVQTYKCPCPS